MPRFLRWTAVGGLALAAMSVGCSREPSEPQPLPQSQMRLDAQAPLLNRTRGAEYVQDQYIVVFKEDVADVDGSTRDVEKTQGFKADQRYSHALKGFAARLSGPALDALRNDPRVAYVEQDQMAHIVATEANPTWGLDRIDQRPLPLDNSYTYNQTGAGVDVYCIDTGIRFTHTDFGGRAIAGFDAITSGGTAVDGNGHGTHTAGTIGGSIYGVAKGARLIAVRVLDNNGSGTYSQVIAGIDWVTADHTTRPAVANMSLGGPPDAALDQAVRNSIADGVTYCIAAGNSTTDASNQSPADVGEAITVGATSFTDAFASFSNYGSLVDVEAPGVNVTSDYYLSDTATATMSGTSMAAPHVTGVVALYLEANPGATPADVQAAVVANATPNVVTGLPAGTANRLIYSVPGASAPPPVVSVPPAPVPASPVNGATGVAVPATLGWGPSSGATSYEVQVASDPGFTTTAYDQAGLTSTSTNVGNLIDGTLYYWRVNATNSAGTSGWSAVQSFTTAAAPAPTAPDAPLLVSPRNGANSVARSTTLDWNPSSGAVLYHIQVSTTPAFTSLVYDDPAVSSTSAYVSGLDTRTTYYWRVNATNAVGTSDWSATWSFKTRRNGL